MKTEGKPFTPKPWQLPHLLATPLGGTVLIVERCEYEIEQCLDDRHKAEFFWVKVAPGHFRHLSSDELVEWSQHACPLGPVGTVLTIEGVGDFRTTAIDLRQFETMTEEEARLWGTDTIKLKHFGQWLIDTNNADLGEWAWFITLERI